MIDVQLHRRREGAAEHSFPAVSRVGREVGRVTCLTGSHEYYTPPKIIDAARRVMGGIDLDPASCDVAQEVVQAGRYFTLEDSGLLHPWSGRVWLNPPFSRPDIQQFIERLVESYEAGGVEQAILLTEAATDTRWFHSAMNAATAVCWTRGRLRFWRGLDGKPLRPESGPTRGQALFYFGRQVKRFATQFNKYGKVVLLRPRTAATSTCQWCKREFQPAKSNAKFCCGGCKQAAYRERCVTPFPVTNEVRP